MTGMKVSVILAHPSQASFNYAIAQAAVSSLQNCGYEVNFHDLYRENFDPILLNDEIYREVALDAVIQRHCEEISTAQGIIIVHPNWWGQPPAILKGWIDRVLRPDVAYRFLEGDSGEGVPQGLLRARVALVFNTADTDEKREMAVFGDPLETLWKNCIFGLCGVTNFYRRVFSIIVNSTPAQRQAWLDEVKTTVTKFFPPVGG
jgi:putative NADPH-quinone reductase